MFSKLVHYKIILFSTLLISLLTTITVRVNAQTPPPPPPTLITYPRIGGHFAIVNTFVSFSEDGIKPSNFDGFYQVGFPIGVNIAKNSKITISVEVVPFIRFENGSSRVSNVLFHPGVVFQLGNGYSMSARAAFETSGRYGLSSGISKVIKRYKGSSLFLAVPLPFRFGNDLPAAFTPAFMLGVSF